MNKLYVLLITASIFWGCSENFLSRTPEDSLTSGDFYKTAEQLDQALIGAYQVLRQTKGFVNEYVMNEMRSDNTHFEYNNTQRGTYVLDMEKADEFLDDANSQIVINAYYYGYLGISRANSVITNAVKVELSDADFARIMGQAKFLRALFYYDLVRYFGRVPVYLKQVTSTDEAYVQRSSVEEVYNTIIDDLKDAVIKLNPPVFPQNGRANQASARMLLADVYIALKKFQLAENELRIISKMGYGLLPNYASVFYLTNKNSVESIFEIQYLQGNQGQQSNWYQFLPLSNDLSKITGITSMSAAGGGGWNVPTKKLIDSYEPNDSRLDASIGVAEGSGVVGNMIIENVKSIVNYTTPLGKRTYFFIKKYVQPHREVYNCDNNFPVYRYSEVLLSLAESLNEQDKQSEALTYLNMVRQRAGLANKTETNKVLLREIIAHERRIEFAFENKRWFDLLRTGKAIEVMNENGEYIKGVHSTEAYLPSNSYNVTEQRLVFPIPYREIQISKLEQNPGY